MCLRLAKAGMHSGRENVREQNACLHSSDQPGGQSPCLSGRNREHTWLQQVESRAALRLWEVLGERERERPREQTSVTHRMKPALCLLCKSFESTPLCGQLIQRARLFCPYILKWYQSQSVCVCVCFWRSLDFIWLLFPLIFPDQVKSDSFDMRCKEMRDDSRLLHCIAHQWVWHRDTTPFHLS